MRSSRTATRVPCSTHVAQSPHSKRPRTAKINKQTHFYRKYMVVQERRISGKKSESESEVVSDYCDPMDCSLPGFSVHGILQARVLEWVAIAFSRGSSRSRDRTRVSRIGDRRLTSEPPGKPKELLRVVSFGNILSTGIINTCFISVSMDVNRQFSSFLPFTHSCIHFKNRCSLWKLY